MAKAEIKYEITPEMIEAGVAELGRYDSRFGYPSNAVERIFMAMLEASHGKNGRHG